MIVRESKSHEPRVIPINQTLFAVIESIPHRVGKVFNIHKDTMTHKMKEYLVKAGFGHMRLHDLRHTFASILAMSETPIKTIAELLGHSDIRVTEIYLHFAPNYLQETINKIIIDI